jgi:aryl-alcohol dehydrogenase-like predicted oxidoreductase
MHIFTQSDCFLSVKNLQKQYNDADIDLFSRGRNMQYSTKQGLSISKLTLGTVQLGLNYGIANQAGKPDAHKSFQILDAAFSNGVNSLDTSSDYGDSEKTIGAFRSSAKNGAGNSLITTEDESGSCLIITKFGIKPEKGISAKEIEKQIYENVENSLNRLGLAKLPVLLLHEPSDLSYYGKPIRDTLDRMKREGLLGKAGVSIYNAGEAELMLEDDFYEVIQVPMNIFDQRLVRKGVLKKLHERDIIVFVRSVFLQGLFFVKPENLAPKLRGYEHALRQLAGLAEQEGMPVDQLALSYIRDLEGVTSLVIGAETPEQVLANVRLINSPCLGDHVMDRIGTMFQDIPEILLDPRLWNKG